MKKIHVLVEGPTERTFIDEFVKPIFEPLNIIVNSKVVVTKVVKGGPNFKGGVNSYRQVKDDVRRLLLDTSATIVTTMLDFYALPTDFPGYITMPAKSCYERVKHLEVEFQKDIKNHRFLPYFSLHEFEALVFVELSIMSNGLATPEQIKKLNEIKSNYSSPEEINEKEPPSKRIKKIVPAYNKVVDGNRLTIEIGIDRIRQACPHFNDWLTTLENLGKNDD